MYNVFALPVKAYQNVCRFISDGRSWLQEERKEGAHFKPYLATHFTRSVALFSRLFQEFQMRIQWCPIISLRVSLSLECLSDVMTAALFRKPTDNIPEFVIPFRITQYHSKMSQYPTSSEFI